MSHLGLSIEGTWLEDCVQRLYDELEAKGIRLRPHVWLSDEWFAPDTAPGFAIPFYLAHPRLMRLERSQILDVEGGTLTECMRIMRHEAGHAIQHAWQLNRRRKWQALFGKSSTRYPRWYRPKPASRRYVQHLRLWYAQAHPDEDFAETFAVWLRPRSDWKRRYASWPALKKLEYVDEVMSEVGQSKPLLASRAQLDPLRALSKTLGQHYEARRQLYTIDYPDIYDRDLRRIFSDLPEQRVRQREDEAMADARARFKTGSTFTSAKGTKFHWWHDLLPFVTHPQRLINAHWLNPAYIIPLVENNYKVTARPKARAFAGLSMGGHHALTVALNHHDTFNWIGAFSSAPPPTNAVATGLAASAALNQDLKLFWIACGRKDFLFQRNNEFVALLKAKDIRHEYVETEGDHSWPVWRRYLTDFAPKLFR
jgi:predicted esterase